MLSENSTLKVDLKKNVDLDLENINLGFDSDSEGKEDFGGTDRDTITGSEAGSEAEQLPNDKSRSEQAEDLEKLSEAEGDRDSIASKIKTLTGRSDEQQRLRCLEDAKDALLEAASNLTKATSTVDKLK